MDKCCAICGAPAAGADLRILDGGDLCVYAVEECSHDGTCQQSDDCGCDCDACLPIHGNDEMVYVNARDQRARGRRASH